MVNFRKFDFVFDFFEGQITESFSLKWSGPNMTKRTVAGIVTGTIDESTALDDVAELTKSSLKVTASDFVLNCPASTKVVVEVFNLSGMMVDKKTLVLNNQSATMSHTNLQKGFYVLRVKDGNKILIHQKVSLNHPL